MVVRQGCIFLMDLFKLYSEAILKELQVVPGIITGGHCLNNIRYTDKTVGGRHIKNTGILRQGSKRKWEEKIYHQL